MPDKNHPGDRSTYYAASKIEAIDVIEAWQLSFCLGNVIKYLSRLGRKPGEDQIEALEKASWYIQREIEEEKRRREVDLSQGTVRQPSFSQKSQG